MIVTNYTKLFSIEFLHKAYSDNAQILRDIDIVPDEETTRIINGSRLYCRTEKNKLFCYVQTIASIDTLGGSLKVTTENKPLVYFDEKSCLNFKINMNSGRFLNNSNLRLFDSKHKVFRFSNDSGNKQNVKFYLSRIMPVYNAAETYKTGSLVSDLANKIFEAISDSNPANVHNTTDILFWKNVTGPVQYVNQGDLVTDSENEKCFATVKISFQKDLANEFSLLKKSNILAEDNTILGKDYIIHFKNNEAN